MNNMVKKAGCNVETYDYESDFQVLNLKEKRGILKNAKRLLNLQKENMDMVVENLHSEKQGCMSLEKYIY